MSSNIKAVLFDKDGTLLAYDASWGPVNRNAALCAAEGDGALADVLLKAGGMDPVTGKTAAGSLLAAGNTAEIVDEWVKLGSPVPKDQLVAALDDIFQKASRNAVAIDGIEGIFADLHERGMKIGIASSDNAASISTFVEHFKLSAYVSFIAGYNSGFGYKPGPGMFLAFCRETGIAPEETAVVGDNLHDMEMAQSGNAGLRIGVLSGTSTALELEGHCDFYLPDITGLAARI